MVFSASRMLRIRKKNSTTNIHLPFRACCLSVRESVRESLDFLDLRLDPLLVLFVLIEGISQSIPDVLAFSFFDTQPVLKPSDSFREILLMRALVLSPFG